jgi:early secretory antigenic target protein ESAT-6
MAGSDYTKAMFASLSAGEQDYQRTYTQVVSTIDTLNGQLRGSLSEWTGSAQAAYHQAQAQWNAAMADMQMVLKNLQGVAAQAATAYPQTEASNAALWG